jgi:hypothetical protein
MLKLTLTIFKEICTKKHILNGGSEIYWSHMRIAFLQCNGYTKIYTQYYATYPSCRVENGTPADHDSISGGYCDVPGAKNQPMGNPIITYTTSNIKNMDELFEKSYEIIQIIGEIGNLVNNIHLFCNEDEIESLMKKITSDIGMDDITYGTKAYHICPLSTLIVLPFLPIAIPLLILIGVFSVPPLLLRRSIEVCKKLTRNDENKKKIIPNEEKKRIIVMQKKMFNNSKIDVDN